MDIAEEFRHSCEVRTVRRIKGRNSLALPYARHKNRTRRKDLTKPDSINRLWETDIHYVLTVHDGMHYLMSIKDCFSKKWISYEFSKTCTARDCIKAVEKAYAVRFPHEGMHNLILRTDNGPQNISREFRESVKLLGIGSEYIQKHTLKTTAILNRSIIHSKQITYGLAIWKHFRMPRD